MSNGRLALPSTGGCSIFQEPQMAREFTMPKLGLTMEEATILEWLVPDGGELVEGAAALRIETDKVETEVEAPASGVLHRVGKEGDVYTCGAVIAFVLSEGEAAPAPTAKAATGALQAAQSSPTQARPVGTRTATGGRQFVSPNARRVATATDIDVRAVLGTGPGGRVAHCRRHRLRRSDRGRDAPPASAAARALADLLGIDLGEVSIDPIERRVTREGVALYARTRLQSRPPAAEVKAPSMPLLQEPDAHDPHDGHARHHRQAHARLAAIDGSADLDHGRRHECGRCRS
jgi:pyruvate dehydrogenase E2 component (dihydrolipoamide acetyltransferase)